jgi:hypothetical protein
MGVRANLDLRRHHRLVRRQQSRRPMTEPVHVDESAACHHCDHQDHRQRKC